MKPRTIRLIIVATLYLLIYIVCRTVTDDQSLLATLEWTSETVFFPSVVIALALVWFNKIRLVLVQLIGYISGLLLGEGIGGFFYDFSVKSIMSYSGDGIPSKSQLDPTHYGWLVFLIVNLLVFTVYLIIMTKMESQNSNKDSPTPSPM